MELLVFLRMHVFRVTKCDPDFFTQHIVHPFTCAPTAKIVFSFKQWGVSGRHLSKPTQARGVQSRTQVLLAVGQKRQPLHRLYLSVDNEYIVNGMLHEHKESLLLSSAVHDQHHKPWRHALTCPINT